MGHIARISATHTFLGKAASIAASRAFPDWISPAPCGAGSSVVMPRVRDSLVLRLVAGRRQDRARNFIHATGAP
jgi:hypothetical protein